MRIKAKYLARWLAAALAYAVAAAAGSAQPPALFDGSDGATCDYFNRGAQIRWRHRLGDWKDARGEEQGSVPFATATVRARDRDGRVAWDVTALVQDWLAGKYVNAGLIARVVRGGVVTFHSREAATAEWRPRLRLELSDDTVQDLLPSADSTLDCSTAYSTGSRPTISAGPDRRIAMQFDLAKLADARVSRATLELTTAVRRDATIELFGLEPPLAFTSPGARPELGIAARYRRDQGIEADPDVIMATGFESLLWEKDWNIGAIRGSFERVDRPAAFGFEPLERHALQVMIPAGKSLGLDMRYIFSDKIGTEPEEIYFRYYLRLGSDWNPSTEGGKLPGITSTYGRVGWGGRKADGLTGWSMRGSFFRLPDVGNPYHDFTPIGTYAYHADMQDYWGDPWAWSESGQALLQRNRWYCIEQYVKVNEPGSNDAVIRAWVDGELVFQHDGFRVRDIRSIRIEEIWMNVYYGGNLPSPQDQHLFIDNVVVARRYIGPMAR